MAVCDLDTLSADACESGFEDLNERALLEIIAVLLWNQAGQSPDLDTLNSQACSAGFVNLSEQKLLVAIAQLLCNLQP